MTTERWDDNRLDRLAELVAQNALGIAETRAVLRKRERL
jgi:hypothetical protein